jgi:tRNA threonylcarbamoyladenosine biosynthesis protein TsaB
MSRDHLLLAIETATPTARVALIDTRAGDRVASREATAARHSSNLLRLCDEVLREAGVAPSALEVIACGAGPGSFTGLRVGLAVAKGLALPGGTPFLLVSSLQALALDILTAPADAKTSTLPGAPPLIAGACIDAGKGQVYLGFYRANPKTWVEPLSEEWVVEPSEVGARAPASGPLVVAGNGAVRYAEVVDRSLAARGGGGAQRGAIAGPTADAIGRLALLRHARGETDDLASAVPCYGRAPDITQPRRP